MRTPNKLALLAVVLGCLVGCGRQVEAQPGDRLDPLRIAPNCEAAYPDDPFTLNELETQGDLLVLDVTYGGGCRTHEFFVCWEGSFLETDPPRAPLRVFHDSNDDPCRALIYRDLYVDLGRIREAYQEGTGEASGTVIVEVAGQSTVYNF